MAEFVLFSYTIPLIPLWGCFWWLCNRTTAVVFFRWDRY